MRVVPMPPDLRRLMRVRASAKGARLERLARRLFEQDGYLVETAPKVLHWEVPRNDPGGPLIPRSTRHDFFGIWDLVAITLSGRPAFIQVTTPENKSHRRRKILESEWPISQEHKDDLILGYAGRGIFRVWIGPDYLNETRPRHVPPERRKRKP